jgi:glutamyl-tRNA synthetase/glutamyl-Q tRNA(Asp) synthetase
MIVTRFAPAPTGYLHLGHVLNALHVWGITRALRGRVLLRVEDHDRQRSRPEYERALLDDLDWLGFVPDEPSTDDFRRGPCRGRQSDRDDVYRRALDGLRSAGLVYACDCTRRDLREAMTGAVGGGDGAEPRYAGRCASRDLEWRDDRGLRVRLAHATETFDDLRHGRQSQRPSEQCGDMLLKDRQRNWTYQFVATVDDMVQGITLVIRGDDLLSSTGRQMQLARLLGRTEPPRFLHHALIMKSASQKLSKADRDTSVRDMRAAGAAPDDVFGRALHAAGFIDAPVAMHRDAAETFVARQYVRCR